MNIKRIVITATICIAVTWGVLSALYDHEFDLLCKDADGVTVKTLNGLACMTQQPVIAEQ